MATKRVLNVGGSSKKIPIPAHYQGFEHILLDINPLCGPDIVCDGRQLTTLGTGVFDAVYCSHNLEHYYRHDVAKVLGGFLHVLKEGGFAQIRVPDMGLLMKLATEHQLDIDHVLYQSPAGPVTVHDVIYGHSEFVATTGQDFYAHKTGFTHQSLINALQRAGFSEVATKSGMLEIDAIASKGRLDLETRKLLGLAGQG